MFAPALLGVGAIIALGVTSAVGKVPLRMAAPLTDRLMPPSTRTRVLSRVHRVPMAVIAPALLIVEVAVLAWLWYRFEPLFLSFGAFIRRSSDVSLAVLNPDNAALHRSFRQQFSLHLLIFTAAWLQVLKLRARRADYEARMVVAGGLALTLASLMLLVAPFRTILHNDSERVGLGSQPCYLVGERGPDVLLFCPTQPPPRSRILRYDDPQLTRDGTRENIFKEVE
jgi:hypothetical protein